MRGAGHGGHGHGDHSVPRRRGGGGVAHGLGAPARAVSSGVRGKVKPAGSGDGGCSVGTRLKQLSRADLGSRAQRRWSGRPEDREVPR